MTARRRPRVLLVRSEHIGDVLLTLPAAVALRRALPAAHIAYLVPPHLEPVATRCPVVDEVLTLDLPPPDATWDPARWSPTVDREAPRLAGRFDAAILFRPADPWAGSLTRAAGIPVRVGYDIAATRPYLTTAIPHRPGRHAARQAMEMVARALAALGESRPIVPVGSDAVAVHASPTPVVVPTSADDAEAERLLCDLPDGAPVVLHPGTGWVLKNWPAARWGTLAAELYRRHRVRPLVTGVPSERELVDEVVAASGERAIAVAGRLSFGGFAEVLRRARLLVATDSGPLHLAALLGTPVVGLYGPVGPAEAGPVPAGGGIRVVDVRLPCSPCGRLTDPPCGAAIEPSCVTGIDVEAVLRAADELLASAA